MRTAPVALAYLDDDEALVSAATALSALTHFDPEAGEACVLWCLAISHAVRTGELDVRRGLARLAPDRQEIWQDRIALAEQSRPADFANNGWVVGAFQAAWSAIAGSAPSTGKDPRHLRRALEAAVRGGNDTDTVAAIAGGLVGAAYGASAVPAEWRRLLHGWPGMTSRHLVGLVDAIERGGRPDSFDYSYGGYSVNTLVRHPYDDKVWLGGIGALRNLPADVSAVVSLCRVGEEDIPNGCEWVEVRLIDRTEEAENPYLELVLEDTVAVIEAFRSQGKSVLVHCVQAHSRTPAVAALYGMRLRGVSAAQALADVCAVLPVASPNQRFREALRAAEIVVPRWDPEGDEEGSG